MDHPQPRADGAALVPAGQRMDHRDDLREKRRRELGAAFNRMGSDSDAEAHNAFDKARKLVTDIGLSFDAILKAAFETSELQEINRDLGRQLHEVMRENAKYRAMRLSYKIKGHIVQAARLFIQGAILGSPIAAVLLLFFMGWIGGGGASALLLPVGLYNLTKGLMNRYLGRSVFGIATLLAGTIGISFVLDYDAPMMRKHLVQQIENMNRDHDLGPCTLLVDYPISQMTYVTNVVGIKDTITVSLATNGGAAAPVQISCAKYYENGVVARRSEAGRTLSPEQPDIFHSIPVATFGNCDLYAQLAAMH